MYLSNLKLWNYRRFGSNSPFDLAQPNLNLNLNPGMNVLIGENDSGKSAIIDAIKLVLKTHSFEWIGVEFDDFYLNQDRLRIELRFDNLNDNEAKNFTEWLGWEGEEAKPFLRLIYDVKRSVVSNRVLPSEVRAGVDIDGSQLKLEAREYLKTTYLKPLRDVKSELIPRKNSRLSQILQGHEAFKGQGQGHHLFELFKTFNKSIEEYFKGLDPQNNQPLADQRGKDLKATIDNFIHQFYDKNKNSDFSVSEGNIKNILEKLELSIKDETNPGLGTLNRLFISAELLHLSKPDWSGLRLGLIEEIEAHLHPQAQMQVVESLQSISDIQLILTTHSPNIGSKIELKRLNICSGGNVFPMGPEYSKLDKDDYPFLERFLDVTKSNLFFAKGVILVEGWTEELLIPALATKIGINLTECGVSIVNVGSLAFLRYAHIFQRQKEPWINLPVAIITDVDIKPDAEIDPQTGANLLQKKLTNLTGKFTSQNVRAFVSPKWTSEFCFWKSPSLGNTFKGITKAVHPQIDDNDFENNLVDKLTKRTFDKVEVASRLASSLYSDQGNVIPIDPADPFINYLIDAIKYASGN